MHPRQYRSFMDTWSTLNEDVTSPEAQPSGQNKSSSAKSVLLVLTVTLAMIVNIANSASFSIALPAIEREMGIQEEQSQWIISAYPLSSGCLLLLCGRLADLYGRKQMFLVGSIMLAVFTLGCSIASDVIILDILRALQGVGAAAQIPASLGILANEFQSSRARTLAFATFSAGGPVGGVIGTSLGGIVTEFTRQTWRSICYVLAALTIICFIGGLFSIRPDHPSEEKDKRVDWFGVFLITVGLVQITFVLSQGELAPQKWATPYIIVTLILGVLFVVAFFFWQSYLERIQSNPASLYSNFTPPPLLKPSIWTRANGRLTAMMAVAFTNWCAFLAWLFWAQLYYEKYKQYSSVETVVLLLPAFVSGVISNTFVGLVGGRVPIVWMLGIGTLSTAAACLLFAVIIPDVTYWAFGLPGIYLGVMGADFVFSAGTLFIAKYALPHEQSVAGALFNTMTQLGTAFGVTVSTVVYHSVSQKVVSEGLDPVSPYHAAQWTTCGFGILATVIGVAAFSGIGAVDTPGENAVVVSFEHITTDTGSTEKIDIEKPRPVHQVQPVVRSHSLRSARNIYYSERW